MILLFIIYSIWIGTGFYDFIDIQLHGNQNSRLGVS